MAVSDAEGGMHALFAGLLPQHHIVDLPEDDERAAALDKLLAQRADSIAGIIVEPLVQGAGGMKFHDAGVLKRLRALADKYDLLLIFDEVFTGFGRTGTMFACEAAGVTPDIIALSKALTGGTLPLAATVATQKVFEAFWSDDPKKALMHGPSYMANALGCAAANASLDLFEQEPRLQQVAAIASALLQGLAPCRSMRGRQGRAREGRHRRGRDGAHRQSRRLARALRRGGRVRAPVRQYHLSHAGLHHRSRRTQNIDRRGGESRALAQTIIGGTMAAYNGPAIDTHHHIWLRKDVPWLADPPIPRMFGDYFGLRRDYPVEEWINDVVPQGVVKSVHVTAMWGPSRALDETRWLQAVADKHGFPHGIVCNADLADPDVDAALKAQKQFANLRGVRQMLYWDSRPDAPGGKPRPDYCNNPDFRRGFALLEKYDLHFELQVYAGQAKYAVELIKAFPTVRMILVHAGMLTDAHAGSDQRMARGAHCDGGFPQSACEDFRARHVYAWRDVTACAPMDTRRDSDFRHRPDDLRQQFPAGEIARELRRFLRRLPHGTFGIHRGRAAQGAFTTMR